MWWRWVSSMASIYGVSQWPYHMNKTDRHVSLSPFLIWFVLIRYISCAYSIQVDDIKRTQRIDICILFSFHYVSICIVYYTMYSHITAWARTESYWIIDEPCVTFQRVRRRSAIGYVYFWIRRWNFGHYSSFGDCRRSLSARVKSTNGIKYFWWNLKVGQLCYSVGRN